MEPFQTVALLEDLPTEGQVGAVVEVLDRETYEVEFVDEAGRTYGLTTLRAHQAVPLIHAKAA